MSPQPLGGQVEPLKETRFPEKLNLIGRFVQMHLFCFTKVGHTYEHLKISIINAYYDILVEII